MPNPSSPPAPDIPAPVIAVVVPCYREAAHVAGVIAGIGPEVARIIVVDDACPDGTGAHVRKTVTDPRVDVVVHETNAGVGGATITGYRRAVEAGADIVVKMDGDGQMDPALIPALVRPIAEGRADCVKGNRVYDLDGLTRMPGERIVGNLVLSFATKLSSGYWDVFDPTNGFTAIHARVVRALPLAKVSAGYFFESDMLFRLNIARAVVAEVPMPARYADETSTLRIRRVLLHFVGRHAANTAKRIFYSYFLRDFNIASIELVLGNLLFWFGVVFGLVEWRASVVTGVPATAGTVILAALPILIGAQMLIAFFNYDTRNVRSAPLHRRLPPADGE